MNKATVVIINSDDYYRYNAPFRQWLFDLKGKQLGDLKTEEAKLLFKNEFVVDWNQNKLSKEFYEKGPNMKTNFEKRVSIKKETDNLGFSKEESLKLFSHSIPKASNYENMSNSSRLSTSNYDDKLYRKRRSEDLDELLPKKEGKAKEIEDRRVRSAYSRFDRNAPNDIELSDDKLYSGATGGNGKSSSRMEDDYAALLRKEKERQTRRDEEKSVKKREKEEELQIKIEKYNQKEREIQEMLKKMIQKK